MKNNQNNKDDELFKALEELRKENPLIGAQTGAQEIFYRITESLKDESGNVNIYDVMMIAGILAGRSCQEAVRMLAKQQNVPADVCFVAVESQNGSRYLMGDNLNRFLIEDKTSILPMCMGFMQHIRPDVTLPDVEERVQSCVKNLGNPAYSLFGRLPEHIVKKIGVVHWDAYLPAVLRFCEAPEEIPMLFTFALHLAMQQAVNFEKPEKILSDVMECVLYAAKLDYTGGDAK